MAQSGTKRREVKVRSLVPALTDIKKGRTAPQYLPFS